MQISPIDVDIEPFDILRENSPNSGQRLTFQRYVKSSRAFDSASPYRLVFWLAESINFVLRSESLRARESTQLTRNWLSFSGCRKYATLGEYESSSRISSEDRIDLRIPRDFAIRVTADRSSGWLQQSENSGYTIVRP